MDLSRKQFAILEAMASSEKDLSQRELERITGYSIGTVSKLIKELAENGY